jgi:hypothetical protein
VPWMGFSLARADVRCVRFRYAEGRRYGRNRDFHDPRLNFLAVCLFVKPCRLLRWFPSPLSGVVSALCFGPSSLGFAAV